MIKKLLYHTFFQIDRNKRPNPHMKPSDRNYHPFLEELLGTVKEMDETPHEDVWVETFDGLNLHGRLYLRDVHKPFCIFVHGYHGHACWDGYGCFKVCKNLGYNLLLVDQRAHGESEGCELSLGVWESEDCTRWTGYLTEKMGPEISIVYYGVSMGAVSVLNAASESNLTNVKAVVSDCAFTKPGEMLSHMAKRLHLPVGWAMRNVDACTKKYGSFDLNGKSAIDAVGLLSVPVLFIHGTNDNIVPPSMCDELYEKCASNQKKQVYVEGAAHAVSALTDFETYKNAVEVFLEEIFAE